MECKQSKKRFKLYLEPNSTAAVPTMTLWRKKRANKSTPSDLTCGSSQHANSEDEEVSVEQQERLRSPARNGEFTSTSSEELINMDNRISGRSKTRHVRRKRSRPRTIICTSSSESDDCQNTEASVADSDLLSSMAEMIASDVDYPDVCGEDKSVISTLNGENRHDNLVAIDDIQDEGDAGDLNGSVTSISQDIDHQDVFSDFLDDRNFDVEDTVDDIYPDRSASLNNSDDETDIEEWWDAEEEVDMGINQGSSDENSDSNNNDESIMIDDTLNDSLFEGSKVSKAEALILILSFVMKHCLSALAVGDLLELMNILIGKHVFKSVKSIMKLIFCNNVIQLRFHFYCLYCYAFVRSYSGVSDDNLSCPHCNKACIVSDLSKGNFFVTANLCSQVKSLFQRRDINPHLFYRDSRSKMKRDNTEDIYDGSVYKTMMEDGQPLSNKHNFSYCFNSDGLPVFKSSKFSIWPIFIMINELPPRLRFKNLILAGVWFGDVEPKMEIFLQEFATEANKLAEEGIFWMNEGSRIHSKLFGLCCCADAPARAAMQNTMKFNGYFGCGLCYHPGKIVDRVIKYPFDVCDYNDRTDSEVLEDMTRAINEGRTIRGIKGPSALINLSNFPICWGFPPDFMHCLLLGVVRQLSELWFASPASSPFYIGSPRMVSLIDKRLKSIQPPSNVARAPRPISVRKYWKASEWYSWLLFYGVICLNGILPEEFLQHFIVLVKASFLLLQKSISLADIKQSDVLLFSFVCRFQLLYGTNAMTFNVHQLTHLAKSVYSWGPLWTHSCFPFESANWKIKRQLQGSKGFIMQVMRKFLTLQTLPLFIDHHFISPRVKIFTSKMLNLKSNLNDLHVHVDHIQLVGSGRSVQCSDPEREALADIGHFLDENQSVVSFTRLKMNGFLFCTSEYRTETMKRNNRLVTFSEGRVGKLVKILSSNDQCFMIVKLLILEDEPPFFDRKSESELGHVKICTNYAESLTAFQAKDAVGNCISMNADGIHYIAEFPNYVALN
nr:uncharacterized protein LOC129283847 [Lytechinus pictus]